LPWSIWLFGFVWFWNIYVVIWICNFLVLNLVILDLYCLGVFGIWICLVLEYLCGYWICNFLVLNLDLYCVGELGVLVIWICLDLEYVDLFGFGIWIIITTA